MENNIKNNGCVYFFKHNGLNPIKIGYSQQESPHERFTQFKTYAPFGGKIVDFVICENPIKVEKYLHEKFNLFRLEGEWFNLEEGVLKAEILYLKNKYEINEKEYKEQFADFISKKTKIIANLKYEELPFSFHFSEGLKRCILRKKEILKLDNRLSLNILNSFLSDNNVKYKVYRINENGISKNQKGIEIFL